MTVDRWCSTCEEVCFDHDSICTVCGTALESSSELERLERLQQRNDARLRLQEERLEQQQQRTASLIAEMHSIRAQIGVLEERTTRLEAAQWQEAPPEAIDPQASSSHSRPTAKATLEQIPRIVLNSKSSIMQQVNIEVADRKFVALLGEFGPTPSRMEAVLVVSSPRTGKGGLTVETKNSLRRADRSRTVLYMERGDGVTFVEKALMAQEAGASAVIVGNNTQTPWPYIMKDSKGEAASLSIPVIMVKQSDGVEIDKLNLERCALDIETNSNECVVCREKFELSQTVVRLPSCGHVFHEACAMTWLNHHNTCPYCRWELPTDDAEYEQERRRTQRTHSGSETANNRHWLDLYG